MKQTLFTLFLLFFISAFSHAQPVGQWGICEFASKAAMDAYDPSDSQWNCKKAFVNATGDHYRWIGDSWEKEANGIADDDDDDDDGDSGATDPTLICDDKKIQYSYTASDNSGNHQVTFTNNDGSALGWIWLGDAGNGWSQVYNNDPHSSTLTLSLPSSEYSINAGGCQNLFMVNDDVFDGEEEEEESSSCDCRVLKINTSAQVFSGSDKHNWTPPNYTTSPYYEVYRINVTADTDVTGINASGVLDGQKITLLNIGTKKMKFKHENSSSSSANRFMLVDYNDETINKGESITFIYDATSAKWWVYAINQ